MRYMAAGLIIVVALGGCRIKKERVRGKTRVEIQGETVQVTTESTKVKIGRESTKVPLPRVHIGADSGTRSTR